MKKPAFLLILCIIFSACKNDVLNSGVSILPDEDDIVVNFDTFSLRSSIEQAEYIYSSPDSMLLGECDSKFGTIHADILTQLACPEGYRYEDNAEIDSVCIFLSYNSWYGEGNSPMSISVYEMDRQTFRYTDMYRSDLDIYDYWSGEQSTQISEQNKIVVAASAVDSTSEGNYFIRIKTTDSFAERFFMLRDFSSQENYTKQFKGLYITSQFGSSVMLNVSSVSLAVYYHFTYSKAGTDTLVNNEKWFYANSEVRSVNSITYSNKQYDKLEQEQDSVCYIVSPANIYTNISIPIGQMTENIKQVIGTKRPYVNMARMQIDVLNVYTGQTSQKTADDWAQPSPYMILIKQNAAERFFTNKELPTDTCAILSSLSAGTDSVGNTIYYYSYDLKTLITQQLRDEQYTDTLNMTLIPVSVETSSSSYSSTSITAVYPIQTITATTIRSAQNSTEPMQLEVVFSGF